MRKSRIAPQCEVEHGGTAPNSIKCNYHFISILLLRQPQKDPREKMKTVSFYILILLMSCLSAKEKVKQDYSKLGVEGPTSIEINIPDIDRDQEFLSDRSYRFTLTPKYTIWPLKDNERWGKSGFSVAYIGVYDFYFGTKDSGPVISRKQNPLGYIFSEHKVGEAKYLKTAVGMGHESNGQFISSRASYDSFQKSFDDSIHGADNTGKNLKYYQYNLEDWTSMGWNYYLAEWTYSQNKLWGANTHLSFKTHARWFLTHGSINPSDQTLEENIFYDSTLAGKTSIRDYDGLRYILALRGESRHWNFAKEYHLFYDPSIELSIRHGYLNRAFNPSFEIKVYSKILGSLPLFYRFDYGYGRDLSNYAYHYSSHAFGVEIGNF